MSTGLPRTIALKLEQTLAQWRQWHCEPALKEAPQIVDVLTGGISNYSIRVSAGQDFVVRIDGIDPTRLGLHRQAEHRTLRDAHAAGLAPCPRYFNPELGSLVCDYLAIDAASVDNPRSVAQLLCGIHALPARHARLDHTERARRYEKILERREGHLPDVILRIREPVQVALQELHSLEDDAPVLCHNDLLAANRLSSAGRLWAIDWEYCAMGSRWYDLAVTIVGDELGDEQARHLLTHYLGREPDQREWQRVVGWGCIYRYLELLWYLAEDPSKAPRIDLAAKSALLHAQLDVFQAGNTVN